MNGKKQILLSLICAGLVMCLSACGIGKKWIFSLNGEKIYNKDVAAFGLIYANEYNIGYADELQEIYEGNETYEEYYKNELEDEILSTVLLYAEAKKNGCELTKKEKEEVSQKTGEIITEYGTGWLKERKISKSDIEKIYEMKLLGDSYIESQTRMGKTVERSSKYIKVYQVTFSTVLLDEDGMIKSNQDGTVQRQSEEEVGKIRLQAEEFAEKVKSGEEIEKLLAEYDSVATGLEKTMKYEDLYAEYRQAVDKLSKGECSGVIPAEYGYYVIKLLENEDEEYAQTLSDYEFLTIVNDKKDEIVEELYDTYLKDEKDYKNSKQWDDVTISSFLK